MSRDDPARSLPNAPVVPDGLTDPARIRLRRRVAWMDTDAAGIYHWSTIIRFAEEAEAELHTALGIAELTFGATPRVKAGFQFRRPLRFNDPAWIEFSVVHVGRSSVGYAATVRDEHGELVAEGEFVTAFIDIETRRAIPLPDAVRTPLTSGGEQRPEGR